MGDDGPTFFQKPVRDLHWALASAHLLAEDGDIAVLSDTWCAALVQRSLGWLEELERSPDVLVGWLSKQRNVRRLGFYFAALLEFWVRFCPHLAEPGDAGETQVLTQQQIHVGLKGEVAGQLKCVFRRRFGCAPAEPDDLAVQLSHWESHVKYFAFVSQTDPMLSSSRCSPPLHPIRSKSGRPVSLPPSQKPSGTLTMPQPAQGHSESQEPALTDQPLPPPPVVQERLSAAAPPEQQWRQALVDAGVESEYLTLAEYLGPFLGENLLQAAVLHSAYSDSYSTWHWHAHGTCARAQDCSNRACQPLCTPAHTWLLKLLLPTSLLLTSTTACPRHEAQALALRCTRCPLFPGGAFWRAPCVSYLEFGHAGLSLLPPPGTATTSTLPVAQ